MRHVIAGLLGASAAALTVGVGSLAAGSLSSDQTVALSATLAPSDAINRGIKGDRLAASTQVSGKPALVVRLESVGQTSVAIKPDLAAQKGKQYGAATVPGDRVRRAIACEPVVSVLTDVARLLEPGRCVT